MNMKYLIYCRKSTDTEDRQVQSLESQENELKKLAEAQGLRIVGVLHESMSAKSEGRPVFNKMLNMLSSGKADGILCWKLDRLSRNPIDTGRVQSLLQNGIIKNIKTFERDYFPQDNILMMVFERVPKSTCTKTRNIHQNHISNGSWKKIYLKEYMYRMRS